MRLQKFLSRAGVASRREAETWITAGRVAVDEVVVRELGTAVDPQIQRITVDGKPVAIATTRWVAFHKPQGYLTTRRDSRGRRTIYDALPSELQHLRYVGRLDRETEGLLILTNAGDDAHTLQHPSSVVEREYRAWVAEPPSRRALDQLREGVRLEDGPARAQQVEALGRDSKGFCIGLVLVEGRNREVRRLFEAIGHPVRRLMRMRMGPVALGELKKGQWRDLSEAEVAAIARLSATKTR